MAEILSSAVIGEAVNRATSFLLAKNEEREVMSEDMERLEMAHIKMEAALEASRKWNIADASLLRWRGMLKRAAEECDDALALHRRNRRGMDKKQKTEEQEVRKYSFFPRWITHATKSYLSSFASYCVKKDDQQSSIASAVRRFERYADGAGEFIRLVELGGAPRQYMFFDPLIGHLLAGKELNYEVSRGSRRHVFGIRPVCLEERGVEAKLCYDYQDQMASEKNFRLGAMLRLSESTDVVGVILACLQLVTPHFRPTAETVMKELTQLPTQDFSCKPYLVSSDIEHWNYHSILTEWFRPNPRCCKDQQHCERMPVHSVSSTNGSRGSDLFPEPVIKLFLQRNISIYAYDGRRSTSGNGGAGVLLEERPLLKLWTLFTPHASPEDPPLAEGSTTTIVEVINGQEKNISQHTGFSWQQMDELLLPKAIEYLSSNTEATTYQLFWKSRHGTLLLSVEKIGTRVASRTRGRIMRRAGGGGKRNAVAIKQQQEAKLGRWKQRKQVAVDLLKSWAAFAPDKLQGSIMAWIQRVDNTQSKGNFFMGLG